MDADSKIKFVLSKIYEAAKLLPSGITSGPHVPAVSQAQFREALNDHEIETIIARLRNDKAIKIVMLPGYREGDDYSEIDFAGNHDYFCKDYYYFWLGNNFETYYEKINPDIKLNGRMKKGFQNTGKINGRRWENRKVFADYERLTLQTLINRGFTEPSPGLPPTEHNPVIFELSREDYEMCNINSENGEVEMIDYTASEIIEAYTSGLWVDDREAVFNCLSVLKARDYVNSYKITTSYYEQGVRPEEKLLDAVKVVVYIENWQNIHNRAVELGLDLKSYELAHYASSEQHKNVHVLMANSPPPSNSDILEVANIYSVRTGKGCNKSKHFRLTKGKPPFLLFNEAFKRQNITRKSVLKILKKDILEKDKGTRGMNTIKITEVVGQIRETTLLTPEELVNNGGNISLVYNFKPIIPLKSP